MDERVMREIPKSEAESLAFAQTAPDDASTGYLWLTMRAANVLKNCGVQTLGQLRHMTDSELSALPGCGKLTFRELRSLCPYSPADRIVTDLIGEAMRTFCLSFPEAVEFLMSGIRMDAHEAALIGAA